MLNNFERYDCQIALPGFGKEGQERLQKSSVLVVGAGGLGCPAAQYLASCGIGTIGIADDDVVAENNLHRQVLYSPEDTGVAKVEVAAKKLLHQNPSIRVVPYNIRITSSNVMELIVGFDLVVDCTDNFETKFLLNDACVLLGKPLVYGAIYQFEGQVSVWNVLQKDNTYSPNYRDVFPDAENIQVPDCAEGGVIPTLAGIVGCMQANEAIKYFINPEKLLTAKLWIFNVLDGVSRVIKLKAVSKKINTIPGTIATITLEQLRNDLNNFELIDVRTPEEHKTFNIGGKNIPLNDLEDNWDLIDRKKAVVFYCASGKRSVTAANKLKKQMPDITVFSLRQNICKVDGLQ